MLSTQHTHTHIHTLEFYLTRTHEHMHAQTQFQKVLDTIGQYKIHALHYHFINPKSTLAICVHNTTVWYH